MQRPLANKQARARARAMLLAEGLENITDTELTL
jgi:hypothetical protein